MKEKQTHFKGVVISDPCHENWDNMDQREKGRYCASCSKIVYDFTKDTDPTEFFRLYAENNGNVCGNFYEKSPGYFNLLRLRTNVLFAKSKVAVVSLALGWGLLNFKGAKAQQPGDSVKIENVASQADSLGFVEIYFYIKEDYRMSYVRSDCQFELKFANYSINIPEMHAGRLLVKIPKELMGATGQLTIKCEGYKSYKRKHTIETGNTIYITPKRRLKKALKNRKRIHFIGCPDF